MWRWDQQEPFGVNVPDENPSGVGAFDLPLRLPGQYFDKETNLHYNYFRDYDPSIGRYGESDPIGLLAGLNTYAYVDGEALGYLDLWGLIKRVLRHEFQIVETTINLGSGKGSLKRKNYWAIYAMVPDCFVLLDEIQRKWDIDAGAKPSPKIGGQSPMTTIVFRHMRYTEYVYGPPQNAPCCKGSETFGGFDYQDQRQGLFDILQNIGDFIQRMIPDPRPGGKK